MNKKETGQERLAEVLRKVEVGEQKRKLILKQVKEKVEKDKTMKLSIKEGAAASVMTGFGTDYITPYALALNANNAQIGFLSSFVGLLGPIAQIKGSKLMEKFSRKKIITLFVFLQALTWIPILLLSLLFQQNLFLAYLPIILIVFYSIFAIFGALGGPSWFSLLGDIIPEKIRGRYFSKRNRITGTIALIASIIAAFILDFFKTRGLILIGFSILFSLSLIFRLISAYLFSKHYEPKFKLKKGYYFSFLQFIKKAPFNNYGKFVIYVASIHLTVNIAAPFLAVYMLKDLNFSYITFVSINISQAVFMLLTLPLWGKFSDKYGNREMMKISSMLIPLIPILWLFSKSPVYLALVPQLTAGISWAAFNLAASNFIYDSVTPQRRGICVTYFNIMNGIGIFIGASLGGLLAHYLTVTFMNKLLFVFLISGIARFLIVLTLMPKIKEVREVKKPKPLPLYFKDLRPLRGVVFEFVDGFTNGISKIKKKIKPKL